GYGGKGSKYPLKPVGSVDLHVPATGPGARPGAKVAQLASGYFDAGQAVLAQGEALTLFLRTRDPDGKWNHALFARRRDPSSTDMNFNLGSFAGGINFEISTESGFHVLGFPLARIDPRAWHDLLVRYDGQFLQIWCDGTLYAEKPCT